MLQFQTFLKCIGIIFSFVILFLAFSCKQPNSSEKVIVHSEEDSILVWVEQSKLLDQSSPKKLPLLINASQKALLVSNDSLKCKYLSKISYQLSKTNDTIQFRTLNRKALRLAERIKDSTCLSSLHWDLGDYFNKTTVRDSAYYHYAEAERILSTLGEDASSGNLLNRMAGLQNLIGDYTGSEITTFKAIRKLKPLKLYELLYASYNRLGDNAKLLNDFDRSLEYYDEALVYLGKAEMGSLAEQSAKHNIGLVYQKQGQHEKAIVYFTEVLAFDSLRHKNTRLYSRALNNLGRSKLKLNNFEQLPDLFYQALEVQENTNDLDGQVPSNTQLAQYHLAQNDTVAALTNLTRAKELALQLSDNKVLLEILRLFSKMDPKNATEYTEAYAELNDSLQNQERNIRNKFERIRFETDEVNAENKLLARQKQLWTGIAATLLLLGLSTYIIVSQRIKNQKLKFRQEQQASNQEIFNLLLAQKEKVEEGKKLEQKRVSEELHDGVLGRMLGTRMMLLGLNKKTDPEAIAERAKAIAILQEVESEVRAISHELSHAAYQKIDNFILSIEDLLHSVESTSKINFDFKHADDLDYDALNGEIKINLYRMIQESIQNAVKHANCKHIHLSFGADAKDLKIVISDDGKGFVIKKGKKGIGTRNIASRIEKLNGTWEIDSIIGKGTTVTLIIPIVTNDHSNSIKINQEALQEF